MQHVLAPDYRFHRKQRQHRQCSQTKLRVRDRAPRQNREHCICDDGQTETAYPHFPSASNWCTGKDSNLRTSLGGTDLQSVGFNHSPTCAKNRKSANIQNNHTFVTAPLVRETKCRNSRSIRTCSTPATAGKYLVECVRTVAPLARTSAQT